MRGSPMVSVVMPVYNGERHLPEAMESIRNQTFHDYEFIIIDDGSTDGSDLILSQWGKADDRLRIYHQENKGVIASLNRGCQLAQGKYIARMDADDVSAPERFARQVHFMAGHPEIGILGTWITYIEEDGSPRGNWRMASEPGLIGWFLLFGTCLAHPSIMMRREVIERVGLYRREALHVEDYDLWVRAIAITQLANLPEILLQRRIRKVSISSQYFSTQEQNVVRIMHSTITQLLGAETSLETIENLRRLAVGRSQGDPRVIQYLANLVIHMRAAYLKSISPNREIVRGVNRDAGGKLFALAASACRVSPWSGLRILLRALSLNPRLLVR